ncbi:MAG: polysaccharide pyruvyl transferase CsaB [Bacillota bacterium]
MKRILLAGYYGFNNAGDEAILSTIISALKERDAQLELVVLSAAPAKTKQVYSVETVDRFNLFAVSKALYHSDLLLLGGGSLLQDVTSRRSLLYYLGLIYLARQLGVPVSLYAQGVGPIESKLGSFLVPRLLNQVSNLSVRDQDSKELLKELGVSREIRTTVDPVFNLRLPEDKRAEEIITAEGINLTKPVIGVTLRPWGNNDYLTTLVQVLDRVANRLEAEILFLPLHHPGDLAVSRRVSRLMTVPTQIVQKEYRPEEAAALFSQVDLLIGVRLHSLIFAAINQRPLVGISYDPKVDSLLRQLNLVPAGSVDNLTAGKLYQHILTTYQQRQKLEQLLASRVKELQSRVQKDLDLICQLAETRSE